MMIQEFEKLTGIEVSMEEYAEIEQMYYEFDGDKQAFCKKFVKDNGMVTVLRKLLKVEKEDHRGAELELAELRKNYETYSRDMISAVEKLKKELDKEQEWEPYEYRENAKQADYEKLANAGARELTDSEAVEMLADWWGFQPSRIKIIRTVNKIEKNRHGACRRCGEYDRKPLYDATDWNYIRFDCGMMTYEMINGELSFFVH